jgi:hypothetical protein
MRTQKLGYPTSIGIHPSDDKKLFRFHLQFRERTPQHAIEFEMSAEHAMLLMRALQHVQVRNNIPIPATPRPKGWAPGFADCEA